MEQTILAKVVEAEKEIQKRLGAEKAGTDKWLTEVRAEAERSLTETEDELKAVFESHLAEAVVEAEKTASSLIRDAGTTADRLADISEHELKEMISRHIITILPGGQYDSKDVKG